MMRIEYPRPSKFLMIVGFAFLAMLGTSEQTQAGGSTVDSSVQYNQFISSNSATVISGVEGTELVIKYQGTVTEIVRSFTVESLKTTSATVAGSFTGLIGTLANFAVSVTLDEDAREGVTTILEINEADSESGVTLGGPGFYARQQFTYEELIDLGLDGK